MFVTIINDCRDQNAMARQATRMGAYVNAPVSTVGVSSFDELEAAGDLIDMLDAGEGGEGIILVNVAPRHGKGKKWPNGTPFGYFYYKKTLVVSTIDGLSLSLVKKLQLTDTIKLLDLPTVIDAMIDLGQIDPNQREHLVKTQFRSYEFSPRVAKWLHEGIVLPEEDYPIENIQDAPPAVSVVDNFGNCATTMLPSDIDFEPGKVVSTKIGDFHCYERLKDVPDGEAAFIIGSWGLEDKRFVALVIQGGSAADRFDLRPGFELFG